MPYLLVVQADLLTSLATVMVAPVIALAPAETIRRLSPEIEIDGTRFTVSMPEMAAIPRKRLGPVKMNVAGRHLEFVAAIDLLFTGI